MLFRKAIRSRAGFYLVSPLLGFFFFIISVALVSFYVSENNQWIETARAGSEHELAFISAAISADAFDVFFQNYLQEVLDNHKVGERIPIRTQLRNEIRTAISRELEGTYKGIYEQVFNVDCETTEAAYSAIYIRFNGEGGVDVLGSGMMQPFTPRMETAIWPYISHYGLKCKTKDPPIESGTQFSSRWYYLEADCICCQAPNACSLNPADPPPPTRPCPHC